MCCVLFRVVNADLNPSNEHMRISKIGAIGQHSVSNPEENQYLRQANFCCPRDVLRRDRTALRRDL